MESTITTETTPKPSQYPATVEELTKELQRLEQESKEGWAKAEEMCELANTLTRTAEHRDQEWRDEIQKNRDLSADCADWKRVAELAQQENRRLLGVLDRYRAIDDERVSRSVAERTTQLSERLSEAEDNYHRAEDRRFAAEELVGVLTESTAALGSELSDARAAIDRQAAELDGLREELAKETAARWEAVRLANDYQGKMVVLERVLNQQQNKGNAVWREARRWKTRAIDAEIHLTLLRQSSYRLEREADRYWNDANKISAACAREVQQMRDLVDGYKRDIKRLESACAYRAEERDRHQALEETQASYARANESRAILIERCFRRAMRIMQNRVDRLETDLTLVEESLQAAENAGLLRDATEDEENTDVFSTEDHVRDAEVLEYTREQLGAWQVRHARLEKKHEATKLELKTALDCLRSARDEIADLLDTRTRYEKQAQGFDAYVKRNDLEVTELLDAKRRIETERDNAIATVAELEATGQELVAERDAMMVELDQRLAQVEQLRSVVDDLTALASANASDVTAVLVDHVAHTNVAQPVRGLDQATESGPSVRVSTLRGRGYAGPRNHRKQAVSSGVSAVGVDGTKGRTCAFRSGAQPIPAVTERCKKTGCQNCAIGATDLKPEPLTSGWLDRGLDTLSRWSAKLSKAAKRSGGNS